MTTSGILSVEKVKKKCGYYEVSSIGQYIVNSVGQYYWTLVVDISQLPVVKKVGRQ